MKVHVTILVAAILALAIGCAFGDEPELPPPSDAAAVADRVIGADGQDFLRDITAASWDDGGRRAAELFAWIPRDAKSTDLYVADRAGKTAHAIATFLADNRQTIADDPANPALWQSFARSLVPYLGAMVGDDAGVKGFEPLDGVDSHMQHTLTLFATLSKDDEADRIISEAASGLAQRYEVDFAKAALAAPLLADRGNTQRILLQAARLRGLLAGSAYLTNPESGRPTSALAQTQLAFEVASLTARPNDPHINSEFFIDGRLRSPREIADEDWSIYDSQLTVYLASSPRINDAIQQFGRTYDRIATG